jgi:hypothetical protein
VYGELNAAVKYEDFAIHAGGFTREEAGKRAKEYERRAALYDGLGFERLASHYEEQAMKQERVARAAPREDSEAPGDGRP